jgi:hypothetical protein
MNKQIATQNSPNYWEIGTFIFGATVYFGRWAFKCFRQYNERRRQTTHEFNQLSEVVANVESMVTTIQDARSNKKK